MYENYQYPSINRALPRIMRYLLDYGSESRSRNGTVKELTHIGITLQEPWKREILIPHRKANLAAQIAETMWVLAGRNDIEFLSHYLPRATHFSDDGETWRGGYGPRLRAWGIDDNGPAYKIDQLAEVVRILRADPMSRRAVMSIFDPAMDFSGGKDIPCNNWLSFINRSGWLDLHVAIRSNDLMWGWSGINAFEWSALQEIVAGMLGVEVGGLHFSITSLHLYAPHWEKGQKIADDRSSSMPIPLADSPRFGLKNTLTLKSEHAIGEFDAVVARWFDIEETIREGTFYQQDVDTFPEPMMQSWLRVLQWWWTGDHSYLKPLAGTRLEYATHMAMQPPSRKDYRKEAVDLATNYIEKGQLKFVKQALGPYARIAEIPEKDLPEFIKRLKCPKCGEGTLSTSDGRTPLKCIRAVCNHVFQPEDFLTEAQAADAAFENMKNMRNEAVQRRREAFADGKMHGSSDQDLPHQSNDGWINGESNFLRYAIATHNEKHAAYGDSWKRRGEMLGILANIARKVDRLGGAETSDETSADTAMDLMIYLAKYRVWIDDYEFEDYGPSDDTVAANGLLRRIEKKFVEQVPGVSTGDVEDLNEALRNQFDNLEKRVHDKDLTGKANSVDRMLRSSYILAKYLWAATQPTDPMAENGDYRGADND